MAHDVFVSYSSKDKPVADAIVAGLEYKGVRCWIAPRDITPGISWGQAISEAIEESRIMVVILSGNSNQSRQVLREVERAVAKDVVVIPFRIQDIDPTGAMAYFLSSEHWLDAITPPLEKHIEKLRKTIDLFISGDDKPAVEEPAPRPQAPARPPARRDSSRSLLAVLLGLGGVIGLCMIAVLAIGAINVMQLSAAPTPAPTQTSPPPAQTEAPLSSSTPLSIPDFPVPSGWRGYAVGGFYLALPGDWEAVDVDKEGIQMILDLLEQLDPAWAENTAETLSAEEMEKLLKFWAIDPRLSGMGYASVTVIHQPLPLPIRIEDMCEQMDLVYSQMEVEILDRSCTLKINGLSAARYTMRLDMGIGAVKQSQYIYVQGRNMWSLTVSVDENEWARYQADFNSIGESFRAVE
jgi:hypothetical protein